PASGGALIRMTYSKAERNFARPDSTFSIEFCEVFEPRCYYVVDSIRNKNPQKNAEFFRAFLACFRLNQTAVKARRVPILF
ncbi:MAG: hypothetical protein LC114_10930, partial [Bryobacterales bacterium]|nr:hypothetical protein [Bryobacterales bacterium]